MPLIQLALMLYLTGAVEPPSTGTIAVIALVAIAILELVAMIGISRLGVSGDTDADDPDGDGPGWRRDGPRTPPPDEPVCWPDFEREFAEHVAALADRGVHAPAGSSR
jgi:hypothetical protein